MIKGIDISKWQGTPNFDLVKSATEFVIIKSSEGIGFIDPQFKRNQTEARRVGLPLGYYHFCRPDLGNDPAQEADYFLKVIGDLKENEVLCLDFEVTYNDTVNWCLKFLQRVKFMLNGYNPLIYLNQSLIKGNDWKTVVDGGFGLWVAAYTYDPNNNNFVTGAWSFAAIQQYSNNLQVPGIVGGVDANVFFGDKNTFNKYGFHKPIVVVTPPVAPPVVTPPPTPPTQPPAPCSKCIQAKEIIYAKNFWWVKYAKLKELFKT